MSERASEPSTLSALTRDVESAASLVALGMRPKLLPARDPVYADLVRRYGADDRFKDLVNRVAAQCRGVSSWERLSRIYGGVSSA